MARKPETYIAQSIINWVKEQGGEAVHVVGSIKQANQPDIDGSIPDSAGEPIHFKVEVKMPGKDATPAQRAALIVWERNGYLTGVVHSLDEFSNLIIT